MAVGARTVGVQVQTCVGADPATVFKGTVTGTCTTLGALKAVMVLLSMILGAIISRLFGIVDDATAVFAEVVAAVGFIAAGTCIIVGTRSCFTAHASRYVCDISCRLAALAVADAAIDSDGFLRNGSPATVFMATCIGTCTILGDVSTLVMFVPVKLCAANCRLLVVVITPIAEVANIGIDVAGAATVLMGTCSGIRRVLFGLRILLALFVPARESLHDATRRLVAFAGAAPVASAGVEAVSVSAEVTATVSRPSRSFLYSSQANLCSSSVNSSAVTF